jgi:hypothetical protein
MRHSVITKGANDMTNCLSQYATAGEARVARKLIRAALARELSLSVNDGEEWTVKRSRNYREIVDALATTGEDILRMTAPTGDRIGSFVLIYGNDESGEELIADHTDNDICERMYRAAYA